MVPAFTWLNLYGGFVGKYTTPMDPTGIEGYVAI